MKESTGPQLNQVFADSIGKPDLVLSLLRVVEFVASSSSGGADALARLLMSCYDGSEYPFDITELGRLDDELFEDALKIIRLRTRVGHEPHEFFIEGGKLFNGFARDFGLVGKSAVDESELDAPLLS